MLDPLITLLPWWIPTLFLTPSDNGDAPGSATCPIVTAETHRGHYLTSSDSENALGYTT